MVGRLVLPASDGAWGVVGVAVHNALISTLAPAGWAGVAGPMAGLIRLQWWRGVLEKTRPPEHILAPFLLGMMARGQVRQSTLLWLVHSCEMELNGARDLPAWEGMLRDGAGALQRAAGELLGLEDAALLQKLAICGLA